MFVGFAGLLYGPYPVNFFMVSFAGMPFGCPFLPLLVGGLLNAHWFCPFGLFHTIYDVNEFKSTGPVVIANDVTSDDYKIVEVTRSCI